MHVLHHVQVGRHICEGALVQVIHKVDIPEVVGGCGIFLALIHDPLKHLGPILVLHRDDHLVKVEQC